MRYDKILLAHGSGGKLSHELVAKVFLSRLSNPVLDCLNDGAELTVGNLRIAVTTDSFVVKPLFFPGGDIGRLAVCGTVNDLAMQGAMPVGLTAGFIIEEGLPVKVLERVIDSMHRAAYEAGVAIVAGDTKVVEKGAADGLFINTSGVGLIHEGVHTSGNMARAGDAVIISGCLGDHGIAVMAAREGITLPDEIKSDAAPLNKLVQKMVEVCPDVHVLRDPTRGGLATTLNEIALQSKVRIEIFEAKIPIREQVKAFCEIFGFNPLYLANEGKLIAIVPREKAEDILAVMRQTTSGKDAVLIGHVHSGPPKVILHSVIGGRVMLDMLSGEQLPRIC